MSFSQQISYEPHCTVQLTWDKDYIQKIELRPSKEGFWLVSKTACPLVEKWLKDYSENIYNSPNHLPLLFPTSSIFTQKIWQLLPTINWGETITYQELAHLAGAPKAYRAAGSACNKNPFPLFFPCHRVIKAQGLGGFAHGEGIKRTLLQFEGYFN